MKARKMISLVLIGVILLSALCGCAGQPGAAESETNVSFADVVGETAQRIQDQYCVNMAEVGYEFTDGEAAYSLLVVYRDDYLRDENIENNCFYVINLDSGEIYNWERIVMNSPGGMLGTYIERLFYEITNHLDGDPAALGFDGVWTPVETQAELDELQRRHGISLSISYDPIQLTRVDRMEYDFQDMADGSTLPLDLVYLEVHNPGIPWEEDKTEVYVMDMADQKIYDDFTFQQYAYSGLSEINETGLFANKEEVLYVFTYNGNAYESRRKTNKAYADKETWTVMDDAQLQKINSGIAVSAPVSDIVEEVTEQGTEPMPEIPDETGMIEETVVSVPELAPTQYVGQIADAMNAFRESDLGWPEANVVAAGEYYFGMDAAGEFHLLLIRMNAHPVMGIPGALVIDLNTGKIYDENNLVWPENDEFGYEEIITMIFAAYQHNEGTQLWATDEIFCALDDEQISVINNTLQ